VRGEETVRSPASPEWLSKLSEAGLHRRAERLYEELDALAGAAPRRQARAGAGEPQACGGEAAAHRTSAGCDSRGVMIGRVQTPHRFRSKRQFWAYCGLALETRSSADYRFEDGQLVRAKKPVFIRGLNRNHNHDLKNLFKSAATTASALHGPFREFYEACWPKHAAGDGALDAGAQDRRHYLERLEERRKLRRRATEATSSLSVPRGKGLGQFHAGVASSGGGAHGFEGEYPWAVRQ